MVSHLCSVNSVVVTEYSDNPTGLMLESADGSGKFTEVVLNPCVRVKEKEMEKKRLLNSIQKLIKCALLPIG